MGTSVKNTKTGYVAISDRRSKRRFVPRTKELDVIMGLEEDFQVAVDEVSNKINKNMSNDELKEVYALYKQATVGDINTSRPGMLDLKGKAKWDAWNTKKGTSQDEAKQKYIELANQLKEKHGLIG